MANEYKKENIKNTYFEILVLDACGDIYDTITGVHCPQTMLGCARKIDEMKQHDKELGTDFGKWDYRVAMHEEDDTTDWYSVYKIYKYKGKYRCKDDTDYFLTR